MEFVVNAIQQFCLSLPGTSGDVAETQEKDLLLGSTDEVSGDVPWSYGLPTIWLSPHMCIVFYFIIVLVCFLFIALYSVCNSKSFGLTISLDSFFYGSSTNTYMDMFPC